MSEEKDPNINESMTIQDAEEQKQTNLQNPEVTTKKKELKTENENQARIETVKENPNSQKVREEKELKVIKEVENSVEINQPKEEKTENKENKTIKKIEETEKKNSEEKIPKVEKSLPKEKIEEKKVEEENNIEEENDLNDEVEEKIEEVPQNQLKAIDPFISKNPEEDPNHDKKHHLLIKRKNKKKLKKKKKKTEKKKISEETQKKKIYIKPEPVYSKPDIDYTNRPQDPQLLSELEDYTQNWNSLDLRDKLVASLKTSKIPLKNQKIEKCEKMKKKILKKKIPEFNPLSKTSLLPTIELKSSNTFTQRKGVQVPFHLQKHINHNFNILKENVEKQNIIQTSANFHSNLRLSFQELGDLAKIKEKKSYTVENNLLFNTPQKLIKETPDQKTPLFDTGNNPKFLKNLPVEEKSTRPIFLVRRPMSVKYNPERGEILNNSGNLRNLRECDLWGLKGVVKGGKKVRGMKGVHQPKGRCLGLCEVYCGLRGDGMCQERCGAGDRGKRKCFRLQNGLPMKKPKKLIPDSIRKNVKRRVKSMSRKKRDFGSWGKMNTAKYVQYTGKRNVKKLKDCEIYPPTQLITSKHLKVFRGLN